jgi:hypothetical protein
MGLARKRALTQKKVYSRKELQLPSDSPVWVMGVEFEFVRVNMR